MFVQEYYFDPAFEEQPFKKKRVFIFNLSTVVLFEMQIVKAYWHIRNKSTSGILSKLPTSRAT